jgi:type VI secretion system secreted protein Hcp
MVHKQKILLTAIAALAAVTMFSLRLGGGSLEPTGPPAPTMHSLEDIYTAVTAQGPAAPSSLAYVAFLQIDGIPGESTDGGHSGWIDLLSFQWGVGRSASATQPDARDLVITKYIDKASPKLAEACCSGQHIAMVTLSLCPKWNTAQPFLEYKLTDVMISSNKSNISAQLTDRPNEEVSMNYRKIEWTYTMSSGTTVYNGWDFVTNAPTNPTIP